VSAAALETLLVAVGEGPWAGLARAAHCAQGDNRLILLGLEN
jgi:hypothetical protein